MATHRCFGKFLQHLSSYGKSYKGVQQYSEVFRRLIDNSVKVCRAATDIALSVFANDEKTLSTYCSLFCHVVDYELKTTS